MIRHQRYVFPVAVTAAEVLPSINDVHTITISLAVATLTAIAPVIIIAISNSNPNPNCVPIEITITVTFLLPTPGPVSTCGSRRLSSNSLWIQKVNTAVSTGVLMMSPEKLSWLY